MARVRRTLLVIAVIFVIYAVLKDPTQSGNVTSNAWGGIKDAVGSISTFFDTVLSS